jgi:microcystin-dependent protein
MADPFVAEIRIVGFNFAPRGWATCDGQILPISQNTALFSLLGTIYGGDGRTTFALPNLQGRAPIMWGQGPGLSPYVVGDAGGTAAVALDGTQISAHTHQLTANTTAATSGTPGATQQLATASTPMYGVPQNLVAMSGASVSTVGGQPHENRQPYLGVLFVIALQGIFPPRQ